MILIVGGLIAVGLVAAITVVLLARGEQRAENRTTNATPQQTERVPEVQAQREHVTASVQEQQAEAQMALATANTGVPTLVETPEEMVEATPTVGTNHREQSERTERVSLPATGEEQLAAGLTSQYEALTRELREVHQKSNEIERRLSLLNEIATRFEQMQDGQHENGSERMRSDEREINTETDLRPTPSRALDPYR
ncbi:MAG: hypothetical protein H0U76_17535 [Ktedonobacteraceae bacterium]|nr:hypothetical protein [Ktedonobacteraceae bacterium]